MRLMMHFDRMTEMSNISDTIKVCCSIQVRPKTIVPLLTCWLNLFIFNLHNTHETFSSYRSAGKDGNAAAFTAYIA